MSLMNALYQYIEDAMPGGSLNPQVKEGAKFIGSLVGVDPLKYTSRMEANANRYLAGEPLINDPTLMEDMFGDLFGAGITKLVKPLRMSKAQAEAAGLWHPIGYEKKLQKPVSEMRREVVDDPNMPAAKPLDIESLQGSTLIPALGDRSDAGRSLMSVGDFKLHEPVPLVGGHGFMRSNVDPGSVWASGKSRISTLNNRAAKAAEIGDPHLVYMPQSHGTMDFNTMMSDAVLEQLKGTTLSPQTKRAFDAELRKARPEWKGIDDPESLDQINSTGELRKQFMRVAGLKQFQDADFPNLAETRFALTDPSLMDVPLLHGGQSVSRVNVGDISPSSHPSYDTLLGGEYVGGIEGGVPMSLMFPDFVKSKLAGGTDPRNLPRSMELSVPVQVANQEWLDGIMQYLGR